MTTKNNGSKFEVDLSVWQKARDYNEWNKIAQSGDMERISTKLVEVLRAWPYEGDVTNPEVYLDLDMDDWVSTLAAVGDAVTKKFQAIANRHK